MKRGVLRGSKVDRDAGTPAIPVQRINRLGIVQKDLLRARREKRRGVAFGVDGLGDGSSVLGFLDATVQVIAQAIIYAEARIGFPRILKIKVVCLAPHTGFVEFVT